MALSKGSSPFQKYIDTLIERYVTAQRLADAVGISLSAFSRGVRREETLSTENCLRLAKETGEPPSKVLRLAGKGDVADLIESLYGESAESSWSKPQQEVVERWSALPDELRKSFVTILRATSDDTKKSRREV